MFITEKMALKEELDQCKKNPIASLDEMKYPGTEYGRRIKKGDDKNAIV